MQPASHRRSPAALIRTAAASNPTPCAMKRLANASVFITGGVRRSRMTAAEQPPRPHSTSTRTDPRRSFIRTSAPSCSTRASMGSPGSRRTRSRGCGSKGLSSRISTSIRTRKSSSRSTTTRGPAAWRIPQSTTTESRPGGSGEGRGTARRSWNQQSFHETNVTVDTMILVFESASWLANNSYRAMPEPVLGSSLCAALLFLGRLARARRSSPPTP